MKLAFCILFIFTAGIRTISWTDPTQSGKLEFEMPHKVHGDMSLIGYTKNRFSVMTTGSHPRTISFPDAAEVLGNDSEFARFEIVEFCLRFSNFFIQPSFNDYLELMNKVHFICQHDEISTFTRLFNYFIRKWQRNGELHQAKFRQKSANTRKIAMTPIICRQILLGAYKTSICD